MIRVAVAIVGFRNPKDIARCVAALNKSDYRNFEVVICENGGARFFEELQVAIPVYLVGGQQVRVLRAPSNGGFASGVNICMAASPDADAWWILNPDTEPSAGAMAALVKRLNEGKDAVGGALYQPNGKVQSYGGKWRAWFARAVSIGSGFPTSDQPDPASVERVQNYLIGASMMVSRRFLNTVGPMREEYFLYCEEIDWCLRAKMLGMQLGFAPEAHVLHYQGTTTGNLRDAKARSRLTVYLDERNKMLLTRNLFWARLPVAAFLAFLLLGLRYLRKGAVRQFVYGVSGWFDGLTGKRGIPPWALEGET